MFNVTSMPQAMLPIPNNIDVSWFIHSFLNLINLNLRNIYTDAKTLYLGSIDFLSHQIPIHMVKFIIVFAYTIIINNSVILIVPFYLNC